MFAQKLLFVRGILMCTASITITMPPSMHTLHMPDTSGSSAHNAFTACLIAPAFHL